MMTMMMPMMPYDVRICTCGITALLVWRTGTAPVPSNATHNLQVVRVLHRHNRLDDLGLLGGRSGGAGGVGGGSGGGRSSGGGSLRHVLLYILALRT